MALSKGFTLVLHDPESGAQFPFHMQPSPEDIQTKERHLLTLIPLPGLNVVYRESNGADIQTVQWRGTFGMRQRPGKVSPLQDSTTISGTQLFWDFKQLFWDRYLELCDSPDPRISNNVKVEYHDWDANKHYYCDLTDFETPRGKENKTHFRYGIGFQLHTPIKTVLPTQDKDPRTIAKQTSNHLKRASEKLKAAGTWQMDKAQKFQQIVNREVLQPMAELINGLDAFVSGATGFVATSSKAVYKIIDGVALAAEQVGTLVNDAVTVGINVLRNVRRACRRLISAGSLFKTNMDTALSDYARLLTEPFLVTDTSADKEDKEAGRNQELRSYAASLTDERYEGARRWRVRQGDTLQTLALHQMGDARKWRAIAILNGFEGNSDLVAGTDILIPSVPGVEGSDIRGDLSNDRYNASSDLMNERLFGRDLQVVQGADGLLDVVFGQNNDLATVGGEPNLIQAVTLKTRITQGHLLENPNYGLRRLVGERAHPTELVALKHGLEVTAESDPRIASAKVEVEQEGNEVNASFYLTPVGAVGRRPVNAVVGRV